MTKNSRPLAVVTGASSGLGETFARALAPAYDLVLVARRRERLEALARELREAHGCHAEALPADLASDAGVGAVASRIRAGEGCDLLVNNAGFGVLGFAGAAPEAGLDAMHRVHVLAVARLCRAALEGMLARNSGAIINVSSMAAFAYSAGNTSYCATKAWMNHFTTGLGIELEAAGSRVRVQALCPGFTKTEFHATLGVGRSGAPPSFWMDPDFVVRTSLRALSSGRLIVIPGWRYRLLAAISGLLPDFVWRRLAVLAGRKQGNYYGQPPQGPPPPNRTAAAA